MSVEIRVIPKDKKSLKKMWENWLLDIEKILLK